MDRDVHGRVLPPSSLTKCPIGIDSSPRICSASGCTVCALTDRINHLEDMLRAAGYSQEQIIASTPYVDVMGS